MRSIENSTHQSKMFFRENIQEYYENRNGRQKSFPLDLDLTRQATKASHPCPFIVTTWSHDTIRDIELPRALERLQVALSDQGLSCTHNLEHGFVYHTLRITTNISILYIRIKLLFKDILWISRMKRVILQAANYGYFTAPDALHGMFTNTIYSLSLLTTSKELNEYL